MDVDRIPWKRIEPLTSINGEIATRLAGVDALQSAWKDVQANATPAEVEASLKRRLRRHAIETGIIERLYDVSWGVTEALVAEGLTTEVALAEGDITASTLDIIRDQFEALAYLVDWVREGRDLSVGFIKGLHGIIVQHQPTYEARYQFGRTVPLPLEPGTWKELDNRITRSDGTILECTPPLFVEEEMERLVELWKQTSGQHPLIQAAWLHHRFIQIHPFADGNGRVARALTLLSLQRGHYAPITVDRLQRGEYIAALDEANAGDLRPLVRFFTRLEEKALRAEIQAPLSPVPQASGALAVAKAYATRLRARELGELKTKADRSVQLANAVHANLLGYFEPFSNDLGNVFKEFDERAGTSVDQAAPPDSKSGYWHGQLVHAANLADFHTNLADGSWWVRLHLRVRGSLLRFITAVQKVGQGETGVLAVTVYGEVLNAATSPGERQELLFRIFEHPNTPDSATLVYTDDAEERWPEIQHLVDDALAVAIGRFSEHLA
ncbi:Fic family protein [Herbidospora mongoliensis]|uniref:Fic family protein n=1 Tax=Herbidospora mongoliensis TaxID=688067 RepID=UPI00082992F8|nr:Fic family protein [Herbidospora mongoliensis]